MWQPPKMRWAILFFALFTGSWGSAQELNCSASVSYQTVQGNDLNYLRDLEQALRQYINDQLWTEDRFEKEERIDCMFSIQITKQVSLNTFDATLTLTATRPVYQSGTSTTTVSIQDNKWTFTYVPNQSIVHDPNRYESLSSVIDFYIYLLLGYDYDSFSELGGTPFFEKARQLVEISQTQGGAGWQYGGVDQTRGTLIQELTNPRLRPIRLASYQYNYGGLDHFLENPNTARQQVLELLTALEQLSQEGTRPNILDRFFEAKSQEMVSIFENSPYANRAYSILVKIDSGRSKNYDRLIGSN